MTAAMIPLPPVAGEPCWARPASPTYDFAHADEAWPPFTRWLGTLDYDGHRLDGPTIALTRAGAAVAAVRGMALAGPAHDAIIRTICTHRRPAAAGR